MLLKVFHLNILYGRYIDTLIHYLKDKDFDVLCLQEVASGKVSQRRTDNFTELKTRLGYEGERVISWSLTNDPDSHEANAILYKPSLRLLGKHAVYLSEKREFDSVEGRNFEDDTRSLLHLELEKENISFNLITTHLSWGPTSKDTPKKIEAGKNLYEYMRTIQSPFVLTGDFNVDPSSMIISWLDTLGRNLTTEHDVTNTLNPRTHKAPHLFPPGLAVDYMYLSRDVKLNSFSVLEEDLSDHLALTAECEI